MNTQIVKIAQMALIIALVGFLAGCSAARVPLAPMVTTGPLWAPPAPTGLGRMEYTPTELRVDTEVSACIREMKQLAWADDRILTYCLKFGLGDV